MNLRDQLFKLYQPLEAIAVLTIRRKRHPVQLRIIAKARNRGIHGDSIAAKAMDRLIAKHYID